MGQDGIYKKYDKDIKFLSLSKELELQICEDKKNNRISKYSFKDSDIKRRHNKEHDRQTVMRSAFDRDIEKILYLPAYNRYNDKTQVFSFLNNDDVSRRGLHVQLVSKISRNIGSLLGLNTKLIEAIAIGHDIGHTPFGHAGEYILNNISRERTGRYFAHNLHSVRVLDKLYKRNLSLQTLDGILCHNGELELKEVNCSNLSSFEELDSTIESCYRDIKNIDHLVSATLEGCVVRFADIIAYLGKDRIDALQIGVLDNLDKFDTNVLGRQNTTIINNLTVDLVENSYGKNKIMLSDKMFNDLKTAKSQNYEFIYKPQGMMYSEELKLPIMMNKIFDKCIKDINNKEYASPIFKHHIIPLSINSNNFSIDKYLACGIENVVIDYISSMTDTYFMMCYEKMFPNDQKIINFRGYFNI